MVTTAMLAGITTACMVLVRVSYTAWQVHEQEQTARQAGIAVLRHIVRHTRQAIGVSAISIASDKSGTMSLTTASGSTLVWDHDAANKRVLYGVNTATQVLAEGIETLSFVGLRADGVTATTEVGLIQCISAKTSVVVDRQGTTPDETVAASCQAWLRSW